MSMDSREMVFPNALYGRIERLEKRLADDEPLKERVKKLEDELRALKARMGKEKYAA